LILRGCLVTVDNVIDVVENRESLLSAGLGHGNKEVRGGDIGGGNLFVEVELTVQVLGGVGLEKFNVLIRLAQNREDQMLDQDLHVRLKVVPHSLGLDALLHEYQSEAQAGLAQPCRLAHPLLDLAKVALENFRGKVLDEALCELGVLGLVLGQVCGVSVSDVQSVQVDV